MIKVLAFLEAALPTIEPTLNEYMGKYDIVYVWSTGSRVIFILQEKPKRGRPVKEA
jgi:hypothetical protein